MSGTRLLMASSAAFLCLLGLGATFLPAELLAYAGAPAPGIAPLVVQLFGALSFGGAMVNWMGRTNLIGGIYSRPVSVGNALHFTMGALALLKGISAGTLPLPVVALFACYAFFSVSFCLVLFRHPAAPR